jgi:hypothetical protein
VQNFSEAIDDAREAIDKYGIASNEAIEATEDIYIELGKVIKQLDNIPATQQIELFAMLDQQMYDEVAAKLVYLQALADLDLTEEQAQIQSIVGMLGGNVSAFASTAAPVPTPAGTSAYAGFAGFTGGGTVNIYMPAGSDDAAVVRAIERETKRSGALAGTFTGNTTRT